MEGKNCGSNRSQEGDESGETVAAKNTEDMELSLGDVIWVKFSDSSWWPAVVVDDNAVSASYKPDERSTGDVLVRLYGSYEYLYVDPAEHHSEFEFILKQNNSSYPATFRNVLDQELHDLKYGRPKGRGSKFKASKVVKDGAKRRLKLDSQQEEEHSKTPKKAKLQNGKINSPTYEASAERSLKLTPRRIKVMQTLALAAPSGSPFF